MKKWFLISVGCVVAVLLMGCWHVVHAIFYNDELGSKVEWSIIQAVESQHEGKTGERIEIVKVDGYSLVGISVPDTRKVVWIMLNPRNAPSYKQLPKGSYTLSKEDLKKIMASGVVISTVENCLESHVEESR